MERTADQPFPAHEACTGNFIDISRAISNLQDLSGVSEKSQRGLREDIEDGLIFLTPSKREPLTRPLPFFKRKKELVIEQPPLNTHIDQIVVAPMRAELSNSKLADFLRAIISQRDRQHVGVLFLINNSKDDQRASISGDTPAPVRENQLTAAFLKGVIQEDTDVIEQLPLSDSYKALGRHLIKSGVAGNIRYDYVDAIQQGQLGSPHFGALRTYLIDLARIFKNPSVPPEDTIIHFMDVDTVLSPDHVEKLEAWYEDKPSRQANVSEWDLCGASYEGKKQKAVIEQQIAKTRDDYRAWQYSEEINNLLLGKYWESTPTISTRMSYLLEVDRYGNSPRDELFHSARDEDFKLTNYLKRHLGANLGHVGEVLLSDRVQDSRFLGAESDAQRRFDFIQRLNEGILNVYKVNPIFERRYKDANWGDREDMKHPEADFVPFSEIATSWLEHTEGVISNELLEGQKLAEDPMFKILLQQERTLEVRKRAQRGQGQDLNSTSEVTSRLRAIKTFLLKRNLSLLP